MAFREKASLRNLGPIWCRGQMSRLGKERGFGAKKA